ncbi:MAG TPA: MauE/DoxX family redox-associated membrane protein [Chthoniobacterales bacterium]|jgi:uncharacterized membrane protein YphA (DoxX/SURF4 family)
MAEDSSVKTRRRTEWAFLVRRTLAVLVGAVFLYAGIAKVTDPMLFAGDIGNYQIIPWTLGVRIAFYLPWLEIFCGLALIFHRLFFGAVFITSALMILFLGITIWARAHGIDVACGCFGSAGSNLSLNWHLALDVALLAALVALWFGREGNRAVAR